ncbi:acyl-CoA synthetase [Maribacter cobaltidurans]|uniref:Long-chain fatty acid--CoA ligase n=1 Tax=Maribacter cobaltidurans TaxID=1178778 RepID=A0A223V4K4_9FLAO|nr:acyl-CoA synthetase [Maribacter cobaltidurans]ASV30242.1 long-chain fatty acid--CoA ligase [Maribacter cobaltidurans]GGD76968.1 long-chain-fatty-acid--CoA ligase [Maribacter cobaltidurans]
MLTLFERAKTFGERKAISSNNQGYSYDQLIASSNAVASNLLGNSTDLNEGRITFLVPPSFEYTAIQWGIWKAGGIAVPLCVLHPLPSIQYVLEDTQAEMVIAHKDYVSFLKPLEAELGISVVPMEAMFAENNSSLPNLSPDRRAMILYTSGTTSKPKGVVTTHANIEAQITALVEAWEWEKDDYILNILPLHHVHGIINVMSCALWSGACCEFLPKFNDEKVWEIICSGRLTLFMAVPTIYYKLIAFWDDANEEEKKKMSEAASKLRLMVSGSAALPVPVLEKWRSISGQTLLERYGMTEIGMGLSNSYRGERRPGHVGLPLPTVEMRLVDADNNSVGENEPGEFQIKGPSVFKEYWQKPDATEKAFTEDGWFITGDIGMLNDGLYKILGRDSVDIIKSGGYKISALEIEDVMRKHDFISDCAVVGLPDEEWGEVIAACIVPSNEGLNTEELSAWLKTQLPGYKIPRKYIKISELPRNVLGKVTKNEVKKLFETK